MPACPTRSRRGTETERLRNGSQLALRRVNPDIAIIGAGYVGMPHAQTFADAGKRVVLVDIQQAVVDAINRGESNIGDASSEVLKRLVDPGLVTLTTDFGVVADCPAGV